MEFTNLHHQFKQESIKGRYLHNGHLVPLLNELSKKFSIVQLGRSVLDNKIYGLKYGTGNFKILLWSQMHGNETTTTKALIDFINFLDSENEFAIAIRNNFTLNIIPILNPDGAIAYTRVNASQIDLNRDSINLSQPESKILREQIISFKPDLCLNLHDQRTIFGTSNNLYPATLSFLAPSFNETREINNVRAFAMQLISCINEDLQKVIPNSIGRFDDSFNLNCIGDMCTYLNIPTILFEAGHFGDDYEREKTREFIFLSYLSVFNALLSKKYDSKKVSDYLNIPENNQSYFDILYKNFTFGVGDLKKTISFAVQYQEVLFNNNIEFIAKIFKIDNLENFKGHLEYDMSKIIITDIEVDTIKIGEIADFRLNENCKIVNGLLIK